ncbi:GNAT family N-acetyltransferase [Inhella sp.]|uniref:GNAT family N-acetyltransferase n=1 Tax=Inhella sp. TaxID=1921806 RepID=UPI0035B26E4C
MTPDTTLRCLSHPREFDAALMALFAQAERADIESGASWYANLVDTVFPTVGEAVFYVLMQNGQPVAVLPLRREPLRMGLMLHSLSNYYSSRWQPLLADGAGVAEMGALLRALRARERGLVGLRLDALDVEMRALLQQALLAAGFSAYAHFRFKNWTLDAPPDWPAYLASRKGKQRSDLKRMGAKLQEQGGSLSVCLGQDADELAQALADFQRVYASSWKQAEPYADFVPGLVHTAARQGWLRLGRVHLNGQAIAAQIWFVHAGRASIFKVAYDEAFKANSPGSLCTALLMRHVMEQDAVGHVDYLIGDDAYKRLWMNQCRDREALLGFNWRHPLGCLGALREWLAERTRPWRDRWRRRHGPADSETV